MGKAQKRNDSECYAPSSRSIIFYFSKVCWVQLFPEECLQVTSSPWGLKNTLLDAIK
jgi:hypothetical protein